MGKRGALIRIPVLVCFVGVAVCNTVCAAEMSLTEKSDAIVNITRQMQKLLASKNYAEALPLVEKAIEIDPGQGVWRTVKGDLLSNMGRNSEAIEAFSYAIKIDPRNPLPLAGRGRAYAVTSECRRALDDYNAAIRLNGNNGTTFFDRSILQERMGHLDDAARDAAISARLLTGDALAIAVQARIELRRGNSNASRAFVEQALKIDAGQTIALQVQQLISSGGVPPVKPCADNQGEASSPLGVSNAATENAPWAILDVRLGPPTRVLQCSPKLSVFAGFPSSFTCDYAAPNGRVYISTSSNGEVVNIERVQYINTKNGDASPEMILEKAEVFYGRPAKKEFWKLSYRNAEGDELNINAKSCRREILGAMLGDIDCGSGPYGVTHQIYFTLSNPLKKERARQEATRAADEQRNGVVQDRLKNQRF